MAKGDVALVTPGNPEYQCADLEAQLFKAVSDFGADELAQMLDAAEAIRRTRRL